MTAPVPSPLRVAAVVVAVEGAAAAVLGILELFSINSGRLAMGASTAIFLLVYGAGLLAIARGLSHASTWSRGPAVLTQLIQLGVAWSFKGGSTTWVAVLLAAAAITVLVAIFQKASTEALNDRPHTSNL